MKTSEKYDMKVSILDRPTKPFVCCIIIFLQHLHWTQ